MFKPLTVVDSNDQGLVFKGQDVLIQVSANKTAHCFVTILGKRYEMSFNDEKKRHELRLKVNKSGIISYNATCFEGDETFTTEQELAVSDVVKAPLVKEKPVRKGSYWEEYAQPDGSRVVKLYSYIKYMNVSGEWKKLTEVVNVSVENESLTITWLGKKVRLRPSHKTKWMIVKDEVNDRYEFQAVVESNDTAILELEKAKVVVAIK